MSLVRRAWANFQPTGAVAVEEDISSIVGGRGGERKNMGKFRTRKSY